MNILDFVSSVSELYSICMKPLEAQYHLTSMELSILLFLANNPQYDIASEIVEKRHLTKSHVSTSIRSLEERGFLKKERRNGDNRSIHLVLQAPANEIIQTGRIAQAEFASTLTSGFTESDISSFEQFIIRMQENVLLSLNEV